MKKRYFALCAVSGMVTVYTSNTANRFRRSRVGLVDRPVGSRFGKLVGSNFDSRSAARVRPEQLRSTAMIAWEALDALSHELELCRIDSTTKVAILLDHDIDAERAALVRAAVVRTGAQALDIRPVRGSDRGNHPLLLAAVAAADVVVTTSSRHALELQAAAPAVLLLDTSAKPHEYAPHVNLRRRVTSLSSQLSAGAGLHLADDHGTDLMIDLNDSRVSGDYGLIDDDRRYATFPAGWVAARPVASAADGELVLMPGDGNISAERSVSSPIRLTIVNGAIASIHGDSADADIVRALLEYADDERAYEIAEITVGLNPGTAAVAPFAPQLLNPQLARLSAGIVTVSFGGAVDIERFGSAAATLSLALPGRSVLLDELPVSAAGVLVGDSAPDVYEL